jgi:hypothetical protein
MAIGGVGVQPHQQRAAGMTTCQMQSVDAIAMAVEGINDAPCVQPNADGGSVVKRARESNE